MNQNKRVDNISIQDIWKIHTDVQEQMLNLRTAPITIIPEMCKISGSNLHVRVDENNKIDQFIDKIKSIHEIDDESFGEGYFLTHAENVNTKTKKALSNSASTNYIELSENPVIDGYVKKQKTPISDLESLLDGAKLDYDFDNKGRLQLSITNLKKLNDICLKCNFNIDIPEIASIIVPVQRNPLFFIKKDFPNSNITHHVSHYENRNIQGKIKYSRKIEVIGGYFNSPFYEKYNNEFGLELIGYDYVFYVNEKFASKFSHKSSTHVLPKYDKKIGAFVFHTNVRQNSRDKEMLSAYNDERYDFDLKYTRLLKFFKEHIGINNFRFEAKFTYSYDNFKFTKEFLPYQENIEESDWEGILSNKNIENTSISKENESIGIDFNWRAIRVEDTVCDVFNQIPSLNFHVFHDHRCNIDFEIQDVSIDSVESNLKEKFPSIKTKRNNRIGNLYFYQEYKNIEQKIRLEELINNELSEIDSSVFNYSVCDVPIDKEKYTFIIDKSASRESLETAIKEIRGADFKTGDLQFGKLFKVKYPDLVFDISGVNLDKSKSLFETKSVESIEPNLTGDIEKISRLKSSLNNIVNGKNLQNSNLKDFIFDASKAKEIEDIDFHLDSRSETYDELGHHLLNRRINESQKQAIIKTMLAEDLALIQGPPGTGKSTAIAEIIWQHIRKNSQERILLTSETNLAVDNAIDRVVNKHHNLVKPIRFGSEEKLEAEGRQFSIETMKKWVEDKSNFDNNELEDIPQKLVLQNWISNIQNRVSENYLDPSTSELWQNILNNPPKYVKQAFYNSYISNCNVIGATCSSIGEKSTKGFPTRFFKSYCEIFGSVSSRKNRDGKEFSQYNADLKFTTVIQDESSKATPAELSLPLVYGKKNIVIGDHRQLPPLLDKESFMMSFDFLIDRTENETELRTLKRLKKKVDKHFNYLEVSHFERLFNQLDSSLKGLFNLQYRMHPDINEVIKQFYAKDGGLECGLINPVDLGVNDTNVHNPASRYHGIEIDNFVSPENHVVWIDTNSPELLDGTSRINYGEVDAIRNILNQFNESDSFHKYQSNWSNYEDKQIGIISFYGKQLSLLNDLKKEYSKIPVRVSTVDRFQGMERNIIIVSMVRSNRIATDKNQKPDTAVFGELGFPEQTSLGFAQSPNRLNVALSRAKRLLIIVGNSELFRQKDIYDNVYKTIENNPKGKIIKYVV